MNLRNRIEISGIIGSFAAIPGAIIGLILAMGQRTVEAQNQVGLGMTLLFFGAAALGTFLGTRK